MNPEVNWWRRFSNSMQRFQLDSRRSISTMRSDTDDKSNELPLIGLPLMGLA